MSIESKPDGVAAVVPVTSPERRKISNIAGCLAFLVCWLLTTRIMSWLIGADLSHPEQLLNAGWAIGNALAGAVGIALGEGVARLIAPDFSRKVVRGVSKGIVGVLVAAMVVALVVTVYAAQINNSNLVLAVLIMFGAALAGVILYERGGAF